MSENMCPGNALKKHLFILIKLNGTAAKKWCRSSQGHPASRKNTLEVMSLTL